MIRRRIALVVATVCACGPQPVGPGQVQTAGSAGAKQPPPSSHRAIDSVDPDTSRPILAAHNRFRAAHCAPPLQWSQQLEQVAHQWATSLRDDNCAFEHSRNRYGENLAAGTRGALSDESVVEMWYREVEKYDFGRASFGMDTGHFTQLVWRETRHLGCSSVDCKGMTIWVCNYDPPGNVEGAFAGNVRDTNCR